MYQRIISDILNHRGITGAAERKEFLSPRPKTAYDPFLLTNMREGVDRLLAAIDAGRRIVIYGDYDADGVTSTTVLLKTLGCLTDNLTYYIPSRLNEGYGLHMESIDRIREAGGEFIVTVDCGSTSPDEIQYAKRLGIDMVVTDHHNTGPDSVPGIINPKAPGDTYPFKGLAGVGVAYKLALAVSRVRPIPRQALADALEFVTIGTIADIMPLLDENRSFVKYGLMRINSGCRNPGLRRLIELTGMDCRTMKAVDISFGIAPRINAAGRVGDASLGVRLFMAEDPEEIEKYSRELIENNALRKRYQEEAFEQCSEKAKLEKENGDFLLIEASGVHEGILGIVAGKIKDQEKRPTVIVTKNGKEYKGTARSVEKVDIFGMLNRYRDQFIHFGGHRAACGFTIDGDRIPALRENLNRDIEEMEEKDPSLFESELHYDENAEPEDMTVELAEALEVFEPCGKDNEQPVFRIPAVAPEDWSFLKDGKKYARFRVGGLGCVLFHDAAEYADVVESSGMVDVYGTLDINEWRQARRPQLTVTDIRPAVSGVGQNDK